MLKSLQWWLARTLYRSRTKPPKLSRRQLQQLALATAIPEKELRSLYKQFNLACPIFHPNARESAPDPVHFSSSSKLFFRSARIKLPIPQLDRASMRLLYAKFFPFGDPRPFADRVFDVLDTDRDGKVGFREFAQALATARNADPVAARSRLVFAFHLCDSDRDGFITREDVLSLAQSLDVLVGSLSTTLNPSMTPANFEHEGDGHSELVSDFNSPAHLSWTPGASMLHGTPNLLTGYVGCISPRPIAWINPSHTNTDPQLPSTSINLPTHHNTNTNNPTVPAVLNRHYSWHLPPSSSSEWPTELSARVDRLMDLLDVNHDGKVPLKEFLDAVQKSPQVAHAMNLFAGMVTIPSM